MTMQESPTWAELEQEFGDVINAVSTRVAKWGWSKQAEAWGMSHDDLVSYVLERLILKARSPGSQWDPERSCLKVWFKVVVRSSASNACKHAKRKHSPPIYDPDSLVDESTPHAATELLPYIEQMQSSHPEQAQEVLKVVEGSATAGSLRHRCMRDGIRRAALASEERPETDRWERAKRIAARHRRQEGAS